MKLRLLVRLKSVKKWVFDSIFDNKMAEVDERIYFGEKIESN